MTQHDAELDIIFGDGVQYGDCWAGIITCPVVNAPYTFFDWYITSWSDGQVMQQFASKRELLDALTAIAPMEQWTKAG